MNVITLASRKGGAGKSTLTAQLAAQAHASGKRVTVIGSGATAITLVPSLAAAGAHVDPPAGAGRGDLVGTRLAAGVDYSSEETNYTLGLTQLAGELERRDPVGVDSIAGSRARHHPTSSGVDR